MSGSCSRPAGCSGSAAYTVALNAAEQHVDAGTAAMLVNVGPIVIALLGGALLGEGFPRWLLAGAGVAFAGAVLIGVATSGADGRAAGVLLCLVAAVGRGRSACSPRSRAAAAARPAGHLGRLHDRRRRCLPFARGLGARSRATPAPRRSAASSTSARAHGDRLRHLGVRPVGRPAGRLGVTTYLVPPLAVLGAWPLLGETPPPLASPAARWRSRASP